MRPDLVCFSWRDIQIFSPHEGDASLEQAFNFYYSPNPFKKLAASLSGLKSLYQYYAGIRTNLAHVWLIRKICPDARIMIGGGAFGAFAEQLIEKLPEGTIGILGEGEEAVLKMVEGRPLDGERFIARENGRPSPARGRATPNSMIWLWTYPTSLRSFPSTSRTGTIASGCRASAGARTTAPSASIPTWKANPSAIARPHWSCRTSLSTIPSGARAGSGSPTPSSSPARRPIRSAPRSWSGSLPSVSRSSGPV